MTNTEVTQTRTAPWHLWLVGIVALLWSSMGAFDYFMSQTRNDWYMSKFTPDQLEYFYGFPSWAVAAWAIAVWGGVLGCLCLLFRKRLSEPVFLASFVAMVLTTIYQYLLSDGMDKLGGVGANIFAAAIFIFALGLYFYARALRRGGVLT